MRGILAVMGLLAWLAGPAHAADPVGTWKYDKASFEQMAELFSNAMATQLPPDFVSQLKEQLPQMEAQAKEMATSNPELSKQLLDSVDQQRAMAQALESGNAAGFFKEQFLSTAPDFDKSRLDIQAGGKVLYRGVVEGQAQTGEGSWTMSGDTIEILAPMPGGDLEEDGSAPVKMHGTVSADRIELGYDNEPGQDDSAEMAKLLSQLRIVLVRE